MSVELAGLGDRELLDRLRQALEIVDPVPADLVDRMIATVAADDLDEDLELLILVHDSVADGAPAVRGAATARALTFEDGAGLVLDIELTDGRVLGQVLIGEESPSSTPPGSGPARLLVDTLSDQVSVDLDEYGFFAADLPREIRRVRFLLEGPTGRVATPWLDLTD